MTMKMEDNLQEDQAISTNDMFFQRDMAPLKMNTTMDMLSTMYARSEKHTLIVMFSIGYQFAL